jgi:hypothetical protein
MRCDRFWDDFFGVGGRRERAEKRATLNGKRASGQGTFREEFRTAGVVQNSARVKEFAQRACGEKCNEVRFVRVTKYFFLCGKSPCGIAGMIFAKKRNSI